MRTGDAYAANTLVVVSAGMLKPDRDVLKRRAHELGVKHPPNVKLDRLVELVAEAEAAAVVPVAEDAAPVATEPAAIEDAAADHDEDAQPEAEATPGALVAIDGATPAWLANTEIGQRHITLIAHPDVEPNEVQGALTTRTATIPGREHAFTIGACAISPAEIRPVRITLTTREHIDA